MSHFSKFYIFLLICAGLSSSCLTPRESSPVNTYDLGKAEQTNIKLNISTIDQNGPYKNKMIFRLTPESIHINEFERWTQSPDLVLNNYLKRSFLPGGAFTLEGDILSFENDTTTNRAVFTFHYKITKKGIDVDEGIFYGEAQCGKAPAEYASAMAKLARDLIKHISQKISSAD